MRKIGNVMSVWRRRLGGRLRVGVMANIIFKVGECIHSRLCAW